MIARIRRALNINGVKDLEPLTVQLDARWGEGNFYLRKSEYRTNKSEEVVSAPTTVGAQ